MEKNVYKKTKDLFINYFNRQPNKNELAFLESIETLIAEAYLQGLREGAEAAAYLKGVAEGQKEGDFLDELNQ